MNLRLSEGERNLLLAIIVDQLLHLRGLIAMKHTTKEEALEWRDRQVRLACIRRRLEILDDAQQGAADRPAG